MASPFHIFRKYQKSLLVVAGVVLMFVFVIGDSLSQYIGSASTPGPPSEWAPEAIAVRWDGGKLTNRELDLMVMRRRIVNLVIGTIAQVGEEQFDPTNIPPMNVDLVAMVRTPEQGVERDVLFTKLISDEARKAGMRISDESIRRYLLEVGRNRVPTDVIKQIITNRGSGLQQVTVEYVFEALREELLARNYLASYRYAWETVLPEQLWSDWLRVNDRIVLEAAAVPTQSFVVNVPDPPETELRAFFDEYKNREPSPEQVAGVELPSPTPGFAVPQRIKVKYIQANFDKFIEQVEAQVTDEEIETYYEKNKDPQFIKVDLDVFGETSEDSANDNAGTSDENPAEAGSDTGSATVEEVEEEEEEEETETSTAADSETPAATEESAPSAETPEKPTEFQPLEEVRDVIRRRLAEQRVNEQLIALMSELQSTLKNAYDKHLGQTLDAEAAGKEMPPPPPEMADLKSFAEKYGLEYGETDELSLFQLRDSTVIGDLYDTQQTTYQTQFPLVYTLFSPDTDLYKPIDTYDFDNNRYVVIKFSEKPRHVPTFEEARDEVLRAWKLREAAKLALEQAKKDAIQAQEEGKTLKDYFANDSSVKVVQTDPFSFLTTGNIAPQGYVQSYRISQPESILAAGPEFLRAVFGLSDGEVGAALNHDESIAYVVRIVEHLESLDTLRRYYLSEFNQWNGQLAMYRGHIDQARMAVMQDIYASADVDWVRTPDRPRRDEE